MDSEAVFIQVGALADGFAPHSHTLAPLADLAGRQLALHFADGELATLRFVDSQTLEWHGQRVAYRATSIRDGILFIDFLDPQRANASISMVCDRHQGNFTALYGALPDQRQVRLDAFSRVEQGLPLTAVQAMFRFGRLDNRDAPLPQFTDELIGLRNMYTYSPTERYEHIYLNDNFYAWQCLDGVEQGLADVDRCHYVKVAEKLYLFVWREKIVPTLGVVMIDLQGMRTDGKILGYQGSDFAALSNFAVGAHAQVLNVTRHPRGAA
ncbi:molybdenum cofactor biosynthesis F family protein [Serratia sp. AKBS12]|uniref:molybdenum cofactor biosynthesis F family protein n=1 Tax=Serratia sp. AKBS12 TaxID=2974597 RepID=UPI002166BD45|nr:molybdenum cofactor biosynthesis F family protein [Serratia sp. AKBS12]MCS3405850.1 molybdenum cofactor biosynthesis F family protein [Serratia sp. AKBS12]HEI8866702.1 molybdenum cofactor biosynthesis F family protein [Serratia odorifera]